MEIKGFLYEKGADGKAFFTDPLTTAKIALSEVRPNGEPVRAQVGAAIERTTQKDQARSQARDRSQDRGMSM
jgi:hypothetical protein